MKIREIKLLKPNKECTLAETGSALLRLEQIKKKLLEKEFETDFKLEEVII